MIHHQVAPALNCSTKCKGKMTPPSQGSHPVHPPLPPTSSDWVIAPVKVWEVSQPVNEQGNSLGKPWRGPGNKGLRKGKVSGTPIKYIIYIYIAT